jgi:predicted ATPase
MSSDGLTRSTRAEQNLENAAQVPFFKFILTGGPCGGKTTALARIYSYLRERGFQVVTCPEAFSIMESNGMSLDFFATGGMDKVIQNSVMDVQVTLEESLETVLKAHGKPAVLLCDRGPMDGAAYMSEDDWNQLLEKRGVEATDLRDKRYNAVFHMVTAADGAEPFYTLENNATRSESAEQARDLDKKTQKAWVGHPHMYVFDNSTDFEGKRLATRQL